MPITWRNINAPAGGGSAGLDRTAADLLNAGLGRLQSVAQGISDNRIATQQKEYGRVREENTRRALSEIDRRSQDIMGAQEAAQLNQDQIRELVGGKNVDVNRVLDYAKGAEGRTRELITGRQNFEDNQTSRADKPLVQQALASLNGIDTNKGPGAIRAQINQIEAQAREAASSGQLSQSGFNQIMSQLRDQGGRLENQFYTGEQNRRQYDLSSQTEDLQKYSLDALGTFDTEEGLVGAITSHGLKNGYDGTVIQQQLDLAKKLRSDVASMGEAQKREYTAKALAEENAYNSQKRVLDQDYKNDLARLPIPEDRNFELDEADKALSTGDVLEQYGKDLGTTRWWALEWFDSANKLDSTDFKKGTEEKIAAVEKELKLGRNGLPPVVVREAFKKLDRTDEGYYGKSAVEKALKEAYADYRQYEKNKPLRDKLQLSYEEADQELANSKNADKVDKDGNKVPGSLSMKTKFQRENLTRFAR